MKKKNFYSLWAAALLMMAGGCSEELGEGDDSNGGGDGTGDKAYVTVRISSPSTGARTKAGDKPEGGEGGDGFVQGTVDENYIRDVNIFLYKTEQQQEGAEPDKYLSLETPIVGSGFSEQVDNDPKTPSNNHTPQATVEINIPKLGKKIEYYNILTITNAGEKLTFSTVKQLRDYLFEKQDAWEHGVEREDGEIVTTHFVMSTHTMTLGNDKSVVGLSQANNNPADAPSVTVYVERLAARIDLKLGDENGSYDVATDKVQLTAFSVVNRLKAGSYMFKRVTVPELGNDMDKQPIRTESDGDIYLGDEYWNTEGYYNYVIDPWTRGKKVDLFTADGYTPVSLASHYVDNGEAKTGSTSFDDLYINHFNKELNEKETFVIYGDNLPNAGIGENEGNYGEKGYKLIAYTLENTTGWEQQLNGFSTGVIFKGTYTPKYVIKYSIEENKNESVEYANLEKEDQYFYTTKVTTTQSTQDDDGSTGTTTKTVLYADLKSLLVGSFSDDVNGDIVKLLFGGAGSTTTTVTKEEVEAVVNTLQGKFGEAYAAFVGKNIQESVNISDINYEAFAQTIKPNDAEVLAEKYDIHYYKDGTCYYKYWIRHANNGLNPPDNPNLGIMEYGIVRNNLYKLDVTAIKKLGDPLPFTPGVDDPKNPNEDDKTQYYITVMVYVKDWVIRDNGQIEL
ncbi:Mfa1 family fimbria major subunit [uncultured Parabacteroides sp.]|uniref:Mfa1 family fimbria major subunit n=1 Tax=uncultured Parabacteroides sp. TaxID=512312 RepID=UPI00259B335F|nr:Mfa1 family fimbria major subunit [uncultured Parabacteroides sp.]